MADNLDTQSATPATLPAATKIAARTTTYSGDANAFIAPVGLVVFGGSDDAKTATDVTTAAPLPVLQAGSGIITLQASQTSGVTNTTTSRTTTTGLDPYNDLDILINITGAGAATGVLQLFLQDSADGGTTWDDLVASNTFTFGAGVTTQRFKISGRLATSILQGSAAAIETLAAGNVRYGPFGDRIRVREKVSGVSGSPTGVTYTITAVATR